MCLQFSFTTKEMQHTNELCRGGSAKRHKRLKFSRRTCCWTSFHRFPVDGKSSQASSCHFKRQKLILIPAHRLWGKHFVTVKLLSYFAWCTLINKGARIVDGLSLHFVTTTCVTTLWESWIRISLECRLSEQMHLKARHISSADRHAHAAQSQLHYLQCGCHKCA